MPNRSSKPKRPRDINQLAKAIVDQATSEPVPPAEVASPPPVETETPSEALRQAAAELGRRGGLKGGRARAANLTSERRAEIARKAAAARWGKTTD
jgi:hypothetical protein